jgi:hypothetical protein
MARPKKEETLAKIQVRLPKEVIKTLKEESQKSRTTLSDVIRKKLGYEIKVQYALDQR